MKDTQSISTYAVGDTVTIRDDHHWRGREELTVTAVREHAGRTQYQLRGADGREIPWTDWADVDGEPL